jgi:hypothetical protein
MRTDEEASSRFAALRWAILPIPWIADVSATSQSYVKQHFKNGFDYALRQPA